MIRTYTDDTLLWAAFRQGDNPAEKQVFQRYFKPLCLYSERMTGELQPAEDIVAEAFVKAWSRRLEFHSLENLKAFLYRVIRNASINYTVATRQHRQAHAQVAFVAGQDNETESAREREILRVELLQEIYEEIEQLPDRCGQIFKMIFVEQLSTEEIASRLAINPQTVRTQKARAIQLIKTQLLKKNRLLTFLLLAAILETF